jgi:hypothetical protein
VFTGYEDEEYVNDPDNLQVISLGAILNIDDSVLAFIQDEPQCAYERDTETGMFVKIYDFDWDALRPAPLSAKVIRGKGDG